MFRVLPRRAVGVLLCLAFALCGVPVQAQHSADTTGDFKVSLSELLRVVQFYNTLGLHCEAGTEDGYAPQLEGDKSCPPHDSDYTPQNWVVSLSELLRLIQIYNAQSGYEACAEGEDGYCPLFFNTEGEGGEGEGEGEGEAEGPSVVVAVGSVDASPGDTVLLPLTITVENASPSTMQFRLNYNDILLAYSGATGGTALQQANRVFSAQAIGNSAMQVSVTNPLNSSTPIASGAFGAVAIQVSEDAEYGQSFPIFGSNASCKGIGGGNLPLLIANGTINIQATGPVPPRADFTANPVVALPNTAILFTDDSFLGTGSGATYLWDFGDGGTSTQKNPAHIYTTVGAYNVTLTVTTSDGQDSELKDAFITIIDGTRIFVDKGATGEPEDGFTWETAFDTVQEGIDAVSSVGGGEVWVAEGTYNEARGGLNGSLILDPVVRLYGGFEGGETELEARDPSANETIIDGTAARNGLPAIHVLIGADNTVIDGFTIRGGRADVAGNSTNFQGGAIFNLGVTTTIANCRFTDNRAATAGGAIFSTGGNVIIENCTFDNNAVINTAAANQSAPAFGGAVYGTGGELSLVNCIFSENDATATAAWTSGAGTTAQAFGAAVCAIDNSTVLQGCLFDGNTAAATGSGAGTFNEASVAAAPSAFGGGVYVRSGDAVLRDCIVSAGRAQTTGNNGFASSSGAGLYSASCTLTLVNTLVSGNQSVNPGNDEAGTGVCIDNTLAQRTVLITNCNIVRNTTTSIDLNNIAGLLTVNASPVVTNTIVYDNTGFAIIDLGGTTTATYSNIQGGFTGTGNIDAPPGFVNAIAGNFELLNNSPCIDSGRDTSGVGFGAVTTDALGDARGFDGNAGVNADGSNYDIGIDEYVE